MLDFHGKILYASYGNMNMQDFPQDNHVIELPQRDSSRPSGLYLIELAEKTQYLLKRDLSKKITPKGYDPCQAQKIWCQVLL